MSERIARTPEKRARLVKDLSERLLAGMRSGDHTGVLDPVVSRLALDLAGTLTRDSGDAVAPNVVEALSVLVTVHWVRYQLLPEGQQQDDLQACLKWSAVLLQAAPNQVPEPVRAYLAGPDTPVDAAAAEANNRGADLYENYERTGNVQFLQTAITHFGEAVDITSIGHPDRPAMVSNLGNALRAPIQAHLAAVGPGPGHHLWTRGGRHGPGRPPRAVLDAVQPRKHATEPV